ncbi:hypothetical protein PRIC1_003497 [Phytophthora ramorum]
MDATRMEATLRAFYAKHNPGNDQNIAEIVRKFAGRERQLCAKLFKKYGEVPDLISPDSSSDQIDEPMAGALKLHANTKYERDFKLFPLSKTTENPLDFRSAQFNALEALRAPKKHLKLPVTKAYPLDNTQKCRHLLPESDMNRQALVLRPKKTNPSTAVASTVIKKTAPVTPSLFEQLADTYLDGPFRVLRRCFLERMRVFVVVRRVNSVRGTCSGYLKAFDKHVNLVLIDVSQEFVPYNTHERLLREVREGNRDASDAVFSAADRRRNRRVLASAGGMQHEYTKQLFIRGDNVVSVSAVTGNTTDSRVLGGSKGNRQTATKS